MKKIIVFVLCLLLLGACSTSGSSSRKAEKDPLEYLYGTWKLSKVNYNGSDYSVEELEAMDNNSLSEIYLVLKEGGAAYAYSGIKDKGENDQWRYDKENNEVIFNNSTAKYDGTYLIMEESEGIVYFKKYSRFQDITRLPKQKNEEEIKEEVKQENITEKAKEEVEEKAEEVIENVTNNSTIRANVKEAIDAYERFIDEYIEFMNRFSNSGSSSLTLLADYAKYIEKLSDLEDKMDKMEDDLNDAETLYYTEVMLRCSQKLLNAAS